MSEGLIKKAQYDIGKLFRGASELRLSGKPLFHYIILNPTIENKISKQDQLRNGAVISKVIIENLNSSKSNSNFLVGLHLLGLVSKDFHVALLTKEDFKKGRHVTITVIRVVARKNGRVVFWIEVGVASYDMDEHKRFVVPKLFLKVYKAEENDGDLLYALPLCSYFLLKSFVKSIVGGGNQALDSYLDTLTSALPLLDTIIPGAMIEFEIRNFDNTFDKQQLKKNTLMKVTFVDDTKTDEIQGLNNIYTQVITKMTQALWEVVKRASKLMNQYIKAQMNDSKNSITKNVTQLDPDMIMLFLNLVLMRLKDMAKNAKQTLPPIKNLQLLMYSLVPIKGNQLNATSTFINNLFKLEEDCPHSLPTTIEVLTPSPHHSIIHIWNDHYFSVFIYSDKLKATRYFTYLNTLKNLEKAKHTLIEYGLLGLATKQYYLYRVPLPLFGASVHTLSGFNKTWFVKNSDTGGEGLFISTTDGSEDTVLTLIKDACKLQIKEELVKLVGMLLIGETTGKNILYSYNNNLQFRKIPDVSKAKQKLKHQKQEESQQKKEKKVKEREGQSKTKQKAQQTKQPVRMIPLTKLGKVAISTIARYIEKMNLDKEVKNDILEQLTRQYQQQEQYEQAIKRNKEVVVELVDKLHRVSYGSSFHSSYLKVPETTAKVYVGAILKGIQTYFRAKRKDQLMYFIGSGFTYEDKKLYQHIIANVNLDKKTPLTTLQVGTTPPDIHRITFIIYSNYLMNALTASMTNLKEFETSVTQLSKLLSVEPIIEFYNKNNFNLQLATNIVMKAVIAMYGKYKQLPKQNIIINLKPGFSELKENTVIVDMKDNTFTNELKNTILNLIKLYKEENKK